jgi:hypothetical protein
MNALAFQTRASDPLPWARDVALLSSDLGEINGSEREHGRGRGRPRIADPRERGIVGCGSFDVQALTRPKTDLQFWVDVRR